MKNKIIGCFLGALLLGSCSVDRPPFDGAVTDDAVKTETGLSELLNGIYARLRGNGRGIIESTYRNGSFGGDELNLSGMTNDPFISFYTLIRFDTNLDINRVWIDGFKVVYASNEIIKNMPKGQSKELNHKLGEAYYIRALTNLYMLLTFSKPYSHGKGNLGIPLKKTPDQNEIVLRSTVGESYDAVVEDLLKAEELMDGDEKNNIKASQAAAQALLSRVYLYREENAKAITYADKVINSGRYSLLSSVELPKYAQEVPEKNKETIFAFRSNLQENYNTSDALGSMISTIRGVGWGEMYAADPYLQLLQRFPSDVRNDFIHPDYSDGKISPTVYWTQFNEQNKSYGYVIYDAKTEASGITTFKIGENTYTVQSESLEYGGVPYSKNYAEIDGKKQYLTKDYKMNARNGFPKYFVYKLSLQENVPQLFSPIVSRLGELYLIKAEAYAKQNNNTLALENINIIRNRANAPQFTKIPDGKTMLDLVLEERWLELAFEGHRKFDLVRNHKDINRRFPGVHLSSNRLKEIIPPDDNDLVFYIPQGEMIRIPGMQQNP